jgi:hypothetical protein
MTQVMRMKKAVIALSLEARSNKKIAKATSSLFLRERRVKMESLKPKAKEMTRKQVVIVT